MSRFDQRTLAVLSSESGALPLLVIGFAAPEFLIPGGRWVLVAIGAYTIVSLIVTMIIGVLDDRQFAILSFGGMLGIAVSSYAIADPGAAHAVLVLLAAVPALAAMRSPFRLVVAFVLVAAILGVSIVSIKATSWAALLVAAGAVCMAVIVPTYLVATLRVSLMELIGELKQLSSTDPLTKLLNRRGLLERVEELFRTVTTRRRQLGFLVADVDYFKRINDEYGHSVGDAMLVEITRILQQSGPPGSLVVRTGGEEFLVLTEVSGERALAEVAERIRTHVASETQVTMSLGGVCLSLTEDSATGTPAAPALIDTLSGRADQCLYYAKQLGRNRIETVALPPASWRPGHDDLEKLGGPQTSIRKRLIEAARRAPAAVEAAGEVAVDDAAPSVPVPAEPAVRLQLGEERENTMFEVLHPLRDEERITALIDSGRMTFVDGWQAAADELQALDRLVHVDPTATKPVLLDVNDSRTIADHSRYIVVPWRSVIVRIPDKDIFYRLKTARNRHLLTAAEQHKWSRAVVAVAGLSVGSWALTGCVLSGARAFHIADSDELAPTNLNRMLGSVCDLGVSKLEIATRRILEADPYSRVTPFPMGYSPAVADDFMGIADGAKVSVIIEEIDDVAMKIEMRRRARAAGIPVLSATDIGDNVVLDVERYDLDRNYPVFHGIGEEFTASDATDPQQRLRMAGQIVGDALTPRMAYSASQIGQSLQSWPQLGSTAQMAGGVAAAVARMIVCGHLVSSGRYRIDNERTFLPDSQRAERSWNELTRDELADILAALNATVQPPR